MSSGIVFAFLHVELVLNLHIYVVFFWLFLFLTIVQFFEPQDINLTSRVYMFNCIGIHCNDQCFITDLLDSHTNASVLFANSAVIVCM